MKSKQMIPAIFALVAIVAVAFSPTALAVEDKPNDAIKESPEIDTTDKPQVKFRGGTDGWAVIGNQAHESKIAMTGKAIRADNGVWKVTSEAEIKVSDRHAKLELKGKAVDGKIRLHGTGILDSGEAFRIGLSGTYTPVFNQPGDFVMVFNNAKIQFMDNGVNIPLIQSGIVHVEAVNPSTDDYDKFLAESIVQ